MAESPNKEEQEGCLSLLSFLFVYRVRFSARKYLIRKAVARESVRAKFLKAVVLFEQGNCRRALA